MQIVEVRPIQKERWHGYKGTQTFTRPTTIEALVNANTGMFDTGLSPEDRARLEKITGYNLSPEYKIGEPHPFFNSSAGRIKLIYGTNVFDTDKPLDEIKVKILKASDLVANSQQEYDEGKFPLAQFIIYDEQEEKEFKASAAAIKRKVIIEASSLPLDRKADIVQIVFGTNVRKQSADYVDLKIDEAIEKEGAERILALMQRDKARTSLHALILDAIYKNVLRKEGSAIYYMDDQLGFDIESAIDYLADKKNQALKAQIIDKMG